MIRKIPNLITFSRILLSLGLLFFDSFSFGFYLLFSLAGLTDILDGFLARKWHVESKLGAILDTISDVTFVLICSIKILISLWEGLWLSIILLFFILFAMKLLVLAFGSLKFKTFASIHTLGNKGLGLLIFISIYFLSINAIVNPLILVLIIIGFLVSFEEFLILLLQKTYNPNQKHIKRKNE